MKPQTVVASLVLFALGCLPVALATGYPVLDQKPAAGDSGVHYDQPKNTIHTYYGSKDLRQHMEHLMYNQRKHPENKRAFAVGPPGKKDNRKNALAGTKSAPGFARDEKPPNSVVHDGKKVTLRSLPKVESDRERNLLSTTTRKARTTGAKIQFHANPGTDYKGRGARSLSRSGSAGPSSRRSPSRKPAWNAGPGRRASSAPPSSRGRPPARSASPRRSGSRPPPNSPTRGRSPTRRANPGAPRSRSRSPSPTRPGARPRPPSGQRARSAPSRGRPLTRNTTPARSRSQSRSSSPRRSSKAQGKQPARNASPRGRSPARNATPGPSRPRGGSRTPTPNKSPAKPAWNAGPGRRSPSPRPPPRRSTRVAAKPPKPPAPKPKKK